MKNQCFGVVWSFFQLVFIDFPLFSPNSKYFFSATKTSWKDSRYTRTIYSSSSVYWKHFRSSQWVANSVSESMCGVNARKQSESMRNPSKLVGIHKIESENHIHCTSCNVCAHRDSASDTECCHCHSKSLESLSSHIFSQKSGLESRKAVGEHPNASESYRKAVDFVGNNGNWIQERQYSPGSRNQCATS